MGYYTDYTLSIHCDINSDLLGDSRTKEIKDYLLSLTNSDSYLSAFIQPIIDDPSSNRWNAGDSMKWYENEEEMGALSLKFADVVFLLEGKGEEENDLWRAYFLNGRVHICRAEITIKYDDFNPAKLAEVCKDP
jgi:hypothetical protein